jgi:DeoR family transcriptional regulator, fructose operon transcriptional repressor
VLPGTAERAVTVTTPQPRLRSGSRHQAIEGWLAAEGRVDVVHLARRLGVAQETIRRDLRVLEDAGKLERVHGGAVALDAGLLAARAPVGSSDADDLELSARVWAGLPRRGTLLLGTGRLALALAQTIVAEPPAASGLTVVTNSLDAAVVLARASRLEVYNVGGTVSALTRAQEGDWAMEELQRLHLDVSVVCPAGISVERGLTQDTPAAAAVSQLEVASADRVVVLADAGTVGTTAFVQFARLDQVDLLAVAGAPDAAVLQPFLDHDLAVSTAPNTRPDPQEQ